MRTSKTLAAGLYYYATYGCRRWSLRRSCRVGQAPIAILAFHRVADDRANGWTTSTATFAKIIRWLKRTGDVISLDEARRRMRSGSNRRLSVSVTFDDGYADNCRQAIPLLVREQVPCTYFVSTGPVLEGAPFDHDMRLGRPLTPNTVDQLKWMADLGIQLGAHSRTHADLGAVTDPDTLYDEVVVARDDLERAVGRRVRYFAFPFGRPANLSRAAMQLARQAGFAAVCAAYGGYNLPGEDDFVLRRRCLDGPLLRVKNWVNRDPFRQRPVPRLEQPAGARLGGDVDLSSAGGPSPAPCR